MIHALGKTGYVTWGLSFLLVALVMWSWGAQTARIQRDAADDSGGLFARSVAFPDNDNMAWVMLAEEAEERGDRSTRVAEWNDGRPVYWTAPYMLPVRLSARIGALFTESGSIRDGLQVGVIWVNPVIAVTCFAIFLFLAMRWFGVLVGSLTVWGIAASPQVMQRFGPMWVDHHPLALVMGAGTVLAGMAWYSPGRGGRGLAIAVSAICAGMALWISPPNAFVPVGMFVIGVLVAEGVCRMLSRPADDLPDARGWLAWGGIVFVITAIGYIWEFGPLIHLQLDVLGSLYPPMALGGAFLMWGIVTLIRGTGERPKSIAAVVIGLVPVLVWCILFLAKKPELWRLSDPLWQRFCHWIIELQPWKSADLVQIGLVWVVLAMLLWPILQGVKETAASTVIALVILPLATAVSLYSMRFADVTVTLLLVCTAPLLAAIQLRSPFGRAVIAVLAIHIALGAAEIWRVQRREAIEGTPGMRGESSGVRAVARAILEDTRDGKAARIMCGLGTGPPLAYWSDKVVLAAIYFDAGNQLHDAAIVFGGLDWQGFEEVLDRRKATHLVVAEHDAAMLAYTLYGVKGPLIAKDTNGGRLWKGSDIHPRLQAFRDKEGNVKNYDGYKLYRVLPASSVGAMVESQNPNTR